MGAIIKSLCAMSLLCGAAVSLAPEGSAKRMMHLVCSVILIALLLSPLKDLDPAIYSRELARVREREAEFLESGAQAGERLQRSVIEEQCEAYIAEKAAALGMEDPGAAVTARWDTEGFWLPHEAVLSCSYEESLARYLEAELGIPEARQQWSGGNG